MYVYTYVRTYTYVGAAPGARARALRIFARAFSFRIKRRATQTCCIIWLSSACRWFSSGEHLESSDLVYLHHSVANYSLSTQLGNAALFSGRWEAPDSPGRRHFCRARSTRQHAGDSIETAGASLPQGYVGETILGLKNKETYQKSELESTQKRR